MAEHSLMNYFEQITPDFCLLFLNLLFCFQMIKSFRSLRGALVSFLSLRDVTVIFILTLPVVLMLQLRIGNSILITLISVYLFVLWLDAALFVQYKIEINTQSIFWFFTGSKGLIKGIPHLVDVFKQFPPALFLPAIFPMYFLSPVGFALLIFASIVTLILTKRNVSKLLLLVLGLINILVYIYQPNGKFSNAIFLSVVVFILVMNLFKKYTSAKTAFFSSPLSVINLFRKNTLVYKPQDNVNLNDELKSFINAEKIKQIKTNEFASLQGANIILITLESLGTYIEPYSDAVPSMLSKRFRQNRWFSKSHFCLCPNTTVSTNQIYTGAYSNNPYNREDSIFEGDSPEHINTLKNAGYKTFFLDSADTNLYDYRKLLKRIGFDKVWGTDDLIGDKEMADYRLLNMIEPLVQEIDNSPFFLHIINDQTHMPYKVVKKEQFNRHKGNSNKSVYLNAIEEVDSILERFLTEFGEKIDLSNTLIVFTGDHGESFGEYGYSFHSNSVVKEQIQVPFMMTHPKLTDKNIEHSCHFDLFPTFFDLLGIDYNYACLGSPLALTNRAKQYFFHSATLKGNSPANFGVLIDDEFFWIDQLSSQNHIFNFETSFPKRKPNFDNIRALTIEALSKRKLATFGKN
ncbi:sulfatase-like hydrolase/transferase [Catenovulum sp. 2E275]|uniref:sulfatase-like hydrolase/transferase n=1 Tax=Catenovulum sp. 2E275 TaxID=2980497 RepID=UPI0021CFFD60|nr:sulfatase-like hydrolase/transferase [Catenovulum sp. 2E275]MCU4674748.1 sulfatase-like hydrolase/transferase [Catenovulum sp. 2E275]